MPIAVATLEELLAEKKKKKRVRIPPVGPWDSAPCSHLRWHLLGFFRYKLALVKTVVRTKTTAGAEVEVELGQVDIACKKCNTKMTLLAK